METNEINEKNELKESSELEPQLYVLLYNIQSSHNIKSIVNTGLNFGCKGFFYIGNDNKVINKYLSKIKNEKTLKNIKEKFINFPSLSHLSTFLISKKIKVLGLEIGEDSLPIQKITFDGSLCLVLGNEAQGLSKKQRDICDALAYIEQYSDKTASLNVGVAASIAMERFYCWKLSRKG